MAIAVEIRDYQKRHLTSLLKVKREIQNAQIDIFPALRGEIESVVAVMEPMDVEFVEGIIGVKAL